MKILGDISGRAKKNGEVPWEEDMVPNWDYIAISVVSDYGSFMVTAATAPTTTEYELTRRRSQLPYVILFAKLEKIQLYYVVCLQPIIFFVLAWCF